jgi:glycosyltransferase involved in cell wall biosynthesis
MTCPKIVFFSTQYPSETTIPKELEIMAQHYDVIYYLPTKINTLDCLQLNPAVNIVTSLSDNKNWKSIKFSEWLIVFEMLTFEMLKAGQFIPYLKRLKTYVGIAAQNVLYYRVLKKIIEDNDLQSATFYDYWFENVTLALALLKKNKIINNAVCRVHGFDLYDERWQPGIVPYRNFKIKYIDKVYPISNYGKKYFLSKIEEKYHKKVEVCFLGTNPQAFSSVLTKNKKFVIVSVSNTQNFKRVHLIPEVLNKINEPIHWVHFGSGEMDDLLKEKALKLEKHISFEIKGNVPNNEIFDFYKTNKVDLFLSLSLTEGVPVSMMEAISFGIPIMALNIGGISDVVKNATGILLKSDDSVDEIAHKICKIIKNYPFEKKAIIDFHHKFFNLNNNYRIFFTKLINFYD